MSLELTARLTLSSCVSQLTEFYSTNIMPLILDHGYQRLIIKLCDDNGELLPYRIELTPNLSENSHYALEDIQALVLIADGSDPDKPFNIRASFCFDKGNMGVSTLYKCALHCCGDFIKFSQKGL